MENEIQELRREVQNLTTMLKELTSTVNSLNNRTTNHINFIEKVYSSLKYPLTYFKSRIEYITGYSKELNLDCQSMLE